MPTDAAVLVIGDNGLEKESIAKAFQNAGFSNPVHVFKDIEEGKKYLQGHGLYADRKRFPLPRLALLDYHDPEPNGWELLRWMRSKSVSMNLPVVVFGASDGPVHEERVSELAAAYHVKPQKTEQYEELIRRIGEFWLIDYSRDGRPETA